MGEFHYLHHPSEGPAFGLDRHILRAAKDAGIRIVLLQVELSLDVNPPLPAPTSSGSLRASGTRGWTSRAAAAPLCLLPSGFLGKLPAAE